MSPFALPDDPGLPGAAALLDPRVVAAAVDFPVGRARVRYLEYRPGRSCLLLVEVTGTGRRDEVVLGLERGGAPRLDRYPHDPGLPLLAEPGRLAELLATPLDGPPRRLAWMPRRRAVLRFGDGGSGGGGSGDVVVKLYGDPAEAVAAVAALRAVEGVLPTAALRAAAPAAGAVAQEALPGTPLVRADARDAAGAAATLLRTLHAADLVGLADAGPGALLRQCAPVVELVCFARPDLAPRVLRVQEHLRSAAPVGLVPVPSHGDFNMGQLLHGDAGPVVVDVDTLCRAPAALDVAAYAANLVSGRDGDVAAAREALALLVDGYGAAPPGLGWYLAASVLRRLDRPLRRGKKDWPRRIELLLEAVEELAACTAGGHDAHGDCS